MTRAPREMLEAMSRAETGDDVLMDDPTGNKLEDVIASKFGKGASLFLPSTQMANLISILHWTKPGNEVILCVNSHRINR